MFDSYFADRRANPTLAFPADCFLDCSQTLPGSNLGPDTGYPELNFSLFSLIRAGKCRYVSQIRPRPLPFTSFLIDYSLTVIPFDAV
jgi:hypothetical protein